MKQLKLSILLTLLLCMVGVKTFAYTCKVNGICYNLNSNNMTATVTYSGYPYNNDYTGHYGGSGLKGLDIIIPPTIIYNDMEYTVTSVGDKAFYDCESSILMSSITLPSTVTSIGSNAFWKCTALTSFTIPSNVTSIGSSAFYGCSGLTSVIIPNSVTSIGDYAFYGCSSLTSVTVGMETPVAITQNVFPNRANATLYVPYGCSEAYELAAYWQDFNEIVERAAYVTDQVSGLTGETGIVAFTCPEVGTLYDAWVEAGQPSKIKVSGNVNRNDLYRVTHTSYPSYHILYIDLSDAHINACTSDDYSHESCKENYLSGLWLGYDDDSGNFWPNILVLPDDLEELYLNGEYYGSGIRKIYSKQSTPCKTTLNYNCSFYVPSGSRLAWKAKTTNPNYVTFIDGPEKTINVQAAGTLQNYLNADEIETINLLTVNGTIDARDFKTIKKMTNLVTLNIFAKIAAYEGYYGPNPSQISYKAREIPAYLFQNHQNLETVQLSAMETGYIIGDHAFDGCTNLSSFNENHYGVISLGDFCFRNTAVHNTILLLGKTGRRYEDDNYVSSWNLTEELNHVGKNPFFGSKVWFSNGYCDSAQNNYDSNTDYYYNITDYCVLPDYFDYNYPQGLYQHPYVELLSKDETILYIVRAIDNHNLVLTEKVKTLADYAISGLNISSVDLGAVTTIGDGFLYQCPLLSEITCDNEAFIAVEGVLYSADQKTLVKYPCARDGNTYTIPSSVENISKWAFESANNLQSITIEAATPPVLGEMVFENVDINNMTLYVPVGSKATYEAADVWTDFNIVEIESNEPEEIEVTDISQMDNVIYIEPTEERTGTEATISFKMKNTAAIRGFQFDLELPEGVAPVEEDGDYVYWLNADRAPKKAGGQFYHTLEVTKQADGTYRFLCGAQQNKTFSGNDGEVAILKVNIANDMKEGDYPIILKNIKLTETDISKYYQTDEVVAKLTIFNYIPGDISGDGIVDVSDYIGVANHILGNTPAGFNARAADVNNDNVIDVSDYIGIANIILTGSIYGNNNAARLMDKEGEQNPQ